MLLPATDRPGLIATARDRTDELLSLVGLQVIREGVLGLEPLLTDGTLVWFVVGVSIGYVREESRGTITGHVAMRALLRVDVPTNVLPEETLVGEEFVAEGTGQGRIHNHRLPVEVIAKLGVVGEECTTHGAGNDLLLGVASGVVLQFGFATSIERTA